MKEKLKELIRLVELLKYECQAGYLQQNRAWIELKELVKSIE